MIQFSNPRLEATFPDWPLGGSKRGACWFKVHHEGKKGARVSRTTTGKPKFTTYGSRACIVDGDNGRTYILLESKDYGHTIIVKMHDLQHDASHDLGRNSSYFRKDVIHTDQGGEEAQAEAAMFNTLLDLLDRAYKNAIMGG